jgi:hypothetical protein
MRPRAPGCRTTGTRANRMGKDERCPRGAGRGASYTLVMLVDQQAGLERAEP